MRLNTLLEAPLAHIEYQRADNRGSFIERDRKVITKYLKDNVYHEKLKGLPFKLYVYLLDDEKLDFGQVYPEGEITQSMLEKRIYSISTIDISFKQTLGLEVLKQVKDHLEQDPTGVHFLMADNFSSTNQISVTPWILVHRFFHAAVNGVGGAPMLVKARNLLRSTPRDWDQTFTMKSVADKDVNSSELIIELLTQKAITGSIKLKPNSDKADDSDDSDADLRASVEAQFQEALKAFDDVFDAFVEGLKGRIYFI